MSHSTTDTSTPKNKSSNRKSTTLASPRAERSNLPFFQGGSENNDYVKRQFLDKQRAFGTSPLPPKSCLLLLCKGVWIRVYETQLCRSFRERGIVDARLALQGHAGHQGLLLTVKRVTSMHPFAHSRIAYISTTSSVRMAHAPALRRVNCPTTPSMGRPIRTRAESGVNCSTCTVTTG